MRRLNQIDIRLSSIQIIPEVKNIQMPDVKLPKQKITWINLKGNSSTVSPGKTYTLEAQTGEVGKRTTINGGGRFKCSQATISEDNGSTCKVKIRSDAQGAIEVNYIINENVVNTRKIQILAQ